jgi:UDPglucose 6-dehydrogenase
MDERSAELTKYAANSMLATKISFINEIANICERVGADVEMVRRGLAADPRIGPQFLFPGVGYGGSCFPKDVRALMKTAEESGERFDMLAAVESVNRRQKTILMRKILQQFSNKLNNKIIGVWGLSYKPRTDDMREAPSIAIINGLLKAGAKVKAHDPVSNANAAKIFKSNVKFFEDSYDAIKDAEALVVVTEWNEFRRPDFERMKALMKRPIIFDGRNIFDPSIMREKGFVYFGIGRNGG